ncbi:MAG: choice-of-anchor Q domain-containing protein [Deltaproteobacteria bacterium]|jgi:CSLREA domain-containing protein
MHLDRAALALLLLPSTACVAVLDDTGASVWKDGSGTFDVDVRVDTLLADVVTVHVEVNGALYPLSLAQGSWSGTAPVDDCAAALSVRYRVEYDPLSGPNAVAWTPPQGSLHYPVLGVNPGSCTPYFWVNDTVDGSDATPGDGICATASRTPKCTLRAAIEEANALPGLQHVGFFANQTINSPITISDDLFLNGNGRRVQVTSGRFFDVVGAGTDVTLERVHLDGGNSGTSPGGQIKNAGRLRILDSYLENGHCSGYSGAGGSIHNLGFLQIEDSELAYHSSGRRGGALFNEGDARIYRSSLHHNETAAQHGGAIEQDGGELWIESTTLAENVAAAKGGAINVESGTVFMRNATVAYNEADWAGGISMLQQPETFYLSNSIVSLNISTDPTTRACIGFIESLGHNVIESVDPAECTIHPYLEQPDTIGTALAPALPPLYQDVFDPWGYSPGGMLIDAGAPGVNEASPPDCGRRDQRGTERTAGACDIGAVEAP